LIDGCSSFNETLRGEFELFISKDFANAHERIVTLEKKVSSLYSHDRSATHMQGHSDALNGDSFKELSERVAALEDMMN
jgi:hypothetical protein